MNKQEECPHGTYQDTQRSIDDPSWQIKCICTKCGSMFSNTNMPGEYRSTLPRQFGVRVFGSPIKDGV